MIYIYIFGASTLCGTMLGNIILKGQMYHTTKKGLNGKQGNGKSHAFALLTVHFVTRMKYLLCVKYYSKTLPLLPYYLHNNLVS